MDMTTAEGTTMEDTRTPVWFDTDKNGRQVAYRWSMFQFRSFRIGVEKAREMILTDEARLIPCHPFPKVRG